jgi:transposase-like protein
MKYSKMTEHTFNVLIKGFSRDLTAVDTAVMAEVHVNTAERIFQKLRERVASLAVQETEEALEGEFEVDETYFGPQRIPGKRGRGAGGKTPVFGVLKRNGNVYTQIISDCSRRQILPIIQGRVLENSTIYSDGWMAYDSLIVDGYDHHRIYHAHNEFARGKSHINGIESFWSFTKRRMHKFNGFTQTNFPLFLKESEFRFNHRRDNLRQLLLTHLKNNPLS